MNKTSTNHSEHIDISSNIDEKARVELEKLVTVLLGPSDRDLFFQALDNPPEPNASLATILKAINP